MEREELEIYQLSMDVGEEVWGLVNNWDYFSKVTIGKKLVKSVDSIASNLSKSYDEKVKIYSYYSRSSLCETRTLITKAKYRKLIKVEEYSVLLNKINIIGNMLNNFIGLLEKNNRN